MEGRLMVSQAVAESLANIQMMLQDPEHERRVKEYDASMRSMRPRPRLETYEEHKASKASSAGKR
jgi:hypothetical protein